MPELIPYSEGIIIFYPFNRECSRIRGIVIRRSPKSRPEFGGDDQPPFASYSPGKRRTESHKGRRRLRVMGIGHKKAHTCKQAGVFNRNGVANGYREYNMGDLWCCGVINSGERDTPGTTRRPSRIGTIPIRNIQVDMQFKILFNRGGQKKSVGKSSSGFQRVERIRNNRTFISGGHTEFQLRTTLKG